MYTRMLAGILAFTMATTPTVELAGPIPSEEIDILPVIETVTVEEPEYHLDEYIEYKKELSQKASKYVEPEEPEVEEVLMSEEDIELIALVTMAEAEGESELGKRLVIDTILNRVDSKRWPDTAHGVIYQAHQFESMWNGRVDRCYVRDDIVQLVREELVNRTNSKCVFFQMYNYSPYGTDLFKEGCHYFSAV